MKWTQKNIDDALDDGWFVGVDNRLLSKVGCFSTLNEVRGHIVRRALENSPLHLKVLAYLYNANRTQYAWVLQVAIPEGHDKLVYTTVAMARISG